MVVRLTDHLYHVDLYVLQQLGIKELGWCFLELVQQKASFHCCITVTAH